MNWDVIEGNWFQAKGKVKREWDELTDEQLDMVSGKRDRLVGQIQKCYGISKDEAESQVANWELRHSVALDKLVTRYARKTADLAQR